MRNLLNKAMFAFLFAAALAGCAVEGASQSDGIITSQKELSSYLQGTAKSPLDQLSAPARARFLESLEFSERGLSSYDYADLESELSVSEAHAVLSMFGVEQTISMLKGAKIETETDRMLAAPPGGGGGGRTDYKDYKCESVGTCASALFKICTSNC